MVSTRKVHQEIRPGFKDWLATLALSAETKDKLTTIFDSPDILLIGQEMVEILHQLHMDDTTLLAALVYPYCQRHELDDAQVAESFSPEIQKLISGVRSMDAIRTLHFSGRFNHPSSEVQTDNIRRMLLSMVEDVRAVVIKLAERICELHSVKDADEESRVIVAKECAEIYAPLANRLGIGQLKWELEDISFRYLHPETYKNIAKLLDEKRTVREEYIHDFVEKLQALLSKHNIRAKVFGRPKHIYSIWKKMQKKQLRFSELFDIRAVRVIADRMQDCYSALGTVHATWKHIPKEFDDYIATPKTNGYQSIHTVVNGPQGLTVEIQIRTQEMDQDAELGVAAHWKYKEGNTSGQDSYDEKINWLRKILLWQEDVSDSGDIVEELRSQVFDDRVYVFTPKGDVIDLPFGSTPLDFAYYIHSNVGHRCNGAKVSGRIVPFTYQLQTGDQVEVLTSKEPNPSRDWMNPSLGYVHSSRARAKIQTWFKKLDRDKNLIAGREILDTELPKAHLNPKDANKAWEKFNFRAVDELYVAVGAGDVSYRQVVNYLLQLAAPELDVDPRLKRSKSASPTKQDSIEIEGVGNLLTQLARCCRPVPGDKIQGYITIGRGVSVHRQDCDKLEQLLRQTPERTIDVNWSNDVGGSFTTQVDIRCQDRDGMLRDITTVLANEKVTLLGVNSSSDTKYNEARVVVTLEVKDIGALSKTMSRLSNLKGVEQVTRILQ